MKDPHAPLRRDVRLLGDVLGETVRSHAGEGVFEAVERVRSLAKAHRAGDGDAGGRLRAYLAGLEVDVALPVAFGPTVVRGA